MVLVIKQINDDQLQLRIKVKKKCAKDKLEMSQHVFFNSNLFSFIKKVTKIFKLFFRIFDFMTLIGDFFFYMQNCEKNIPKTIKKFQLSSSFDQKLNIAILFFNKKQQNIIFESTSLDLNIQAAIR